MILYEKIGKLFLDFRNSPETVLDVDTLNERTIEKIYPNHIKDLRGHTHKVFVVNERNGRLTIENGKIRSPYVYFLAIIRNKENSLMVPQSFEGSRDQALMTYNDLYNSRQFQISLTTIFVLEQPTPHLMTYEETGYCPLVPKPETTSKVFGFHKVKRIK